MQIIFKELLQYFSIINLFIEDDKKSVVAIEIAFITAGFLINK